MDRGGWLRHAYADTAVVTQVNDGAAAGAAGERWASCSASAPSIVFRMLDMLDLRAGHRVLEIGTGTGWNAALVAHRLGAGRVVSVEVDPVLAMRAEACLRVILVPWESPWLCYGLLRLTVDGYGGASGSFFPYSAFMLMRGQRTDLRIYRDVVRERHVPVESATSVSPWAVAGKDWAAPFAVGLQLPGVWRAWHDEPGVDGVARRLWVATTDAGSWAAVDWDGGGSDRFTVWEHGPRRLWREVEGAHAWWRGVGCPGPGRFGVTIAPDGTYVPWLDTPDRPVPVAVAAG
ncbi:methyltransferase [Streptomyces bacillaris]|uniref:methyltransferase n=1 Tax=Streptomyces bacillaris TaxID=68179 RepID=UPI0034604B12